MALRWSGCMVELSGRIAWVGRKVMDEFEEQYQEANENCNRQRVSVPIAGLVVALLVVSGIALAYGCRQHAMVNQLTAQPAPPPRP